MQQSTQVFRPDWALVGVRVTNNPEWPYMIIASDSLSQAELEAELHTWESLDPWSDPWEAWPPPRPTYMLTANMSTFVLAYGTSYADAFRKIFNTWNPDEPAQASQEYLPQSQDLLE